MIENFDNLKRRLIWVIAYLTFAFLFGTIGYMVLEGYTFLEGAYMTAITMSTVGYGEVKPLTHTGWIFSIVLILMGFVGVAFTGQVLVVGAFEGIWSGRMEAKRLQKQLAQLKEHFIVCGFGRVGTGAVQSLLEANAPFVIIDNTPQMQEQMREKGYPWINGDATSEEVLLQAGIKRAKGLLALLNSDPDNLFLVLTARELNPTLYIVSRANELSSEKKILRAGADEVITPFISAGQNIAHAVMVGSGADVELPTADPFFATPKWVPVEEGSEFVGRTTGDITAEWQHNVLGLRRKGKDTILPAPDTEVRTGDMLFMVQSAAKSEETDKEAEKRLVIVDDNPTILGLYARLFKRRGFLPVTAVNGREGLETIEREKPTAAVIDFMLPILSGIELCQQLRANPENDDIRLILFTADEQEETRRRALEAGADAVVVKSPDASRIIDTVVKMLEAYERQPKRTTSAASSAAQKPETPPAEPQPPASPPPPLVSSPPVMTPPSAPTPKPASVPDETAATVQPAAETSIKIPVDLQGVIDEDEMMDMIGDDRELMVELFRSYVEEAPGMMADIEAAFAAGDGEALRQAAHKIKGTLIYIAAKRAADLAFQMENLGREGNVDAARPIFDEFREECSLVDAYVGLYLNP